MESAAAVVAVAAVVAAAAAAVAAAAVSVVAAVEADEAGETESGVKLNIIRKIRKRVRSSNLPRRRVEGGAWAHFPNSGLLSSL